jgi:hypothetical protein
MPGDNGNSTLNISLAAALPIYACPTRKRIADSDSRARRSGFSYCLRASGSGECGSISDSHRYCMRKYQRASYHSNSVTKTEQTTCAPLASSKVERRCDSSQRGWDWRRAVTTNPTSITAPSCAEAQTQKASAPTTSNICPRNGMSFFRLRRDKTVVSNARVVLQAAAARGRGFD